MPDAALDAKGTCCTAYLMQLKQDGPGAEGYAEDWWALEAELGGIAKTT